MKASTFFEITQVACRSICGWNYIPALNLSALGLLPNVKGMMLSCQPKLLDHLSSKTTLLTLRMKCFWIGDICVWSSRVMICLLVMIYKSGSFITFHGEFVCCLMLHYWKHCTVQLEQLHRPLLFQKGCFCAGHIRRMLNSWTARIPHFTLLPLIFESTKDVLESHSPAISAPLSSAKNKFTVHSCTGCGEELLQ